MGMQSRFVWMDGNLVEYERATIHFLTPECIGLREIDFRVIGNGATGPITKRLQQDFHEVVRGRHPRSAQWLSPVSRETAYGHPVRVA